MTKGHIYKITWVLIIYVFRWINFLAYALVTFGFRFLVLIYIVIIVSKAKRKSASRNHHFCFRSHYYLNYQWWSFALALLRFGGDGSLLTLQKNIVVDCCLFLWNFPFWFTDSQGKSGTSQRFSGNWWRICLSCWPEYIPWRCTMGDRFWDSWASWYCR